MSIKNQSPEGSKFKKQAFNKDVDGFTLPLQVENYSQTAYDVQSLIKVSQTALHTISEMPSPGDCDLHEIRNCLGLANAILDRLNYDIEILDQI